MELDEALREIERLKGEMKKFDGIDPTEITRDRQTLSDQLANTQRQFNEFKQQTEAEKAQLQQQLTYRDLKAGFDQAFVGSKGLQQYGDVLFTTAAPNLELKDGAIVTKDGKPLADVIASYQEKFPAMFAADQVGGSGATGSNTQPTTGGATTVTPNNGIISGVTPESVIKGDVKIQ